MPTDYGGFFVSYCWFGSLTIQKGDREQKKDNGLQA